MFLFSLPLKKFRYWQSYYILLIIPVNSSFRSIPSVIPRQSFPLSRAALFPHSRLSSEDTLRLVFVPTQHSGAHFLLDKRGTLLFLADLLVCGSCEGELSPDACIRWSPAARFFWIIYVSWLRRLCMRDSR